jgi:hypothetical protein
MNKLRSSILSVIAISIAVGIFLPALNSFVHTLQDHDHISLCKNALEIHVHEKKLDCDFDFIALDNSVDVVINVVSTDFRPHQIRLEPPFTNSFYKKVQSVQLGRAPPIA